MRARYLRSGNVEEKGVIDFGYYVPDGSISELIDSAVREADDRAEAARKGLEALVEEGEAYSIELYPSSEGMESVVVEMESGGETIEAEAVGRIGIASHGLDTTMYVRTGFPFMPRDASDPSVDMEPDEILEMYGDWALEHGGEELRVDDVDWDGLMREDNLSRR